METKNMDNEIRALIREDQKKPQSGKVTAHAVGDCGEKSGKVTREKSPLSVAIDAAAERAAAAAAAAAWRAGRYSILRSAAVLIGEGKITRAAAAAAWKETGKLAKHITSAQEEGAIEVTGNRRYFYTGTHDSFFDSLKNLGNIARAFNVKFYPEGNAAAKEAEDLAKINAAAAAAAKEAKRLQLIEARAAAVVEGDFKRAFEISMQIESL